MDAMRLTLIGGPTVLIEIGGLRLLTDPTFDTPGKYRDLPVPLAKLSGPALDPEAIGRIDAVLLNHDQHMDNLDRAGRAYLPRAGRVSTTPLAAGRLGGNASGIAPFETVELATERGRLSITGTPARHGPAGIEPIAGPVTGGSSWLQGSGRHALRHRRYGVVRGARGGGATLSATAGAGLCRLGRAARTVSPYDGQQRRGGTGSRFPGGADRRRARRRLGAFPAGPRSRFGEFRCTGDHRAAGRARARAQRHGITPNGRKPPAPNAARREAKVSLIVRAR